MTAAEIAQLAAAAGIVFALVGLVLIFSLRRTVRTLQRNQRIIFGTRGETDLVGHVADLDEQVGNLRMALEDLAVTTKDHEVRIDGCLARVGMVRFDAYEDLGGHQSTTVCFLDSDQNGVVVTTVVSRDFARMYVKTLKAGESDVPLAPEETEAFEQAKAKGAAPFTVRTRLQKLRQDRGMEYEQPEAEPELETEDEDEQGSPAGPEESAGEPGSASAYSAFSTASTSLPFAARAPLSGWEAVGSPCQPSVEGAGGSASSGGRPRRMRRRFSRSSARRAMPCSSSSSVSSSGSASGCSYSMPRSCRSFCSRVRTVKGAAPFALACSKASVSSGARGTSDSPALSVLTYMRAKSRLTTVVTTTPF